MSDNSENDVSRIPSRLHNLARDLDAHSFSINDGYVGRVAAEIEALADKLICVKALDGETSMSENAEKDAPESSWNYRVTRTKIDGEYVFEIREVYYTHGQPHSWSRDAIAPHGESWHELADDLVKMHRAASMPVFDLTGEKPRDMPLKEMARIRVTAPPDGDADE